ncbi:MAG: zinc dependent phospholipase C family protein [Bacteroidetes bacterium]|nr:zinc dependent phospholipase C family protein [Bacteroidota bacterium]
MKPLKYLIVSLFLIIICPTRSGAFSVYAHLAIVDVAWTKSIVPLLKAKFPNATENELRIAHSYAYGGSLMPDMGYFPFGSVYFTNLVHYVRTGDFMENLVNESQNINEYAFALGAISHYITDEYGHSLATNIAEPMVYPKIEQEYGKTVTYEEAPIYHSRMEFGFDVLQIARGNYASQAYHDFVGFNVAKPVLERAFMITYGENLDSVFHGKLDLNISTFRWSVKSLLPGLTRTAWQMKKGDIRKAEPGMTARKFHFHIKRREYYALYGLNREKPNLRTRITAFIIRIAPKIGPLRALKFQPPTGEAERLFVKAFDASSAHFAIIINELNEGRDPQLADMDFDTGKPTTFGEYGLADQTYSQLVIGLDNDKFSDMTGHLKQHLEAFYSKADSSANPPKNLYDWKKTNYALQELKNAKPVPFDQLKLPADTTKTTIKSSR